MGCDIHMYLEARNNNHSSKIGGFDCIDYFQINPWYEYQGDGDNEEKFEHVPVFEGRSYELFGILAGVRDHSVECICPQKGFPADISGYVKEVKSEWEGNYHSASYLYLDELKAFTGYRNPSYEEIVKTMEERKDKFYNPYGTLELGDKHDNDIRIVFFFDN